MAALDFGMALARGMLPTSAAAQKELIDLAGGRNIFKSEDWWNTQVDKQISSGYRIPEKQTAFLMPSGEYQLQTGVSASYVMKSPFGGVQTWGGGNSPFGRVSTPPGYSSSFGSPFGGGAGGGGWSLSQSPIPPKGAVKQRNYKPGRGWGEDYVTKQVDVFTANAKREDYTASELAAIERSAERGAKRVKSESEAAKAAQRRLRRGTGGLVGKARLPGDAPSTGLPELGTTGLGMTAGLFGADIKL